ncbi:MAG: hypothetical protein WCO64_00140 [Actinomycetes bacterium]
MPHHIAVALFSHDSRIIDEFKVICSITDTSLVVLDRAHDLPPHCTLVFIDPALDVATLSYSQVAVVHLGEPTLDVWQCASQHSAAFVFSLPQSRGAITEMLTHTETKQATTIAFISAVGGSGASVTAAAVAARLARTSESAVLVDLDSRQGALDIVLGAEKSAGTRWDDIVSSESSYRGSDFASALPRAGSLPFLTSRRPITATQLSVDVVKSIRSQTEFLIIDSGTSPLLVDIRDMIDWFCVVLPNTLRAVTLTKHLVASLPAQRKGLVVRSISGCSLSAMTIAESLDIPLLTNIPTDSRIVEQIEQGCGPAAITLGSFSRAISHLTNHLSYRDEVERAA